MKKIISILLLSIVAWPLVLAQETQEDSTIYNVLCTESDMGVVRALPRQATAGTTITLRAMPYDGNVFSEFMVLKCTDFSPIEVTLINDKDGTFEMPACDVLVSAMYYPKSHTIYIEQNTGFGTIFTNPQNAAPAGTNITVTFASNYIGDDNVSTESDISNVTVVKINGGGFSGDEPWGPACAPGAKDINVEVTQTGFYRFTFVMPASDVLITPVIEQIQTVTLNELAASGEEGKIYIVNDEELAVAHYDPTTGIIYAKDNNNADEQEQPESSIDYVRQLGLQQTAWDHSNWLAIDAPIKSGPYLPDYQMGKVIRNIKGKLVDATNLQLMASENPVIAVDEYGSEITMEVTPNNFIPANYYGTQEGTDGNNYFFIAPAANEYNFIHRAVWDAENGTFYTASDVEHGINTMGLQGNFPATFVNGFDASSLIDGETYSIEGITKIMKNEEPSGVPPRLASDEQYSVYVINATQVDIVIPAIPGDVNGDGNVTSADITALYSWLLNNDDSSLVNGDQNSDGDITANDITTVYSILLGNN